MKKIFLSVLVTLLAVSLMAACGEQKEIMEFETVSVSEEQKVESVSSGEEPVKEEERVPEEQEAEQKTEAEEEPVVEPEPVVVKPEPEPIVVPEPIVEPEPIVVPEPEPITPPVSSLPYIRDGRIYLDVREDPEAVNSVLVMTTDYEKWTNELRASRQKLPEYGAYFPVVGEITTYVPGFESFGTFTTNLLDGGIFYVHYTPEIVWDIFGNLSTAIVEFIDDDAFVLGIDFTSNIDIPHEEGLYYFGVVGEGQIKYVVRFYVYFV